MSAYLRVSPEELKVKGNEMYGLAQRLNANCNQIYDKVEMLQASWKGEAFEAFRVRIYGFKSDLDSLRNLLEKYGEFLEVTHANYLNAEARIIEAARDNLVSSV